MLTSIRVSCRTGPVAWIGCSVQKSDCMKMASSYSSVLPPEGTRAAVPGFNDRSEVLLLFPPVRPSELAEPGWELVQQGQNLGDSSCVPLVLLTQRGVNPQVVLQKGVSPKAVPQKCVTKPKPLSAHDNESTSIFPLGYSRTGSFKRSLFDILLIYCICRGDLKYFNGNNSFKGLNQ